MKNRRKQCKATPYKLEVNGCEYGCYKDLATASQITKSFQFNTQFKIYDLNDNVVESS